MSSHHSTTGVTDRKRKRQRRPSVHDNDDDDDDEREDDMQQQEQEQGLSLPVGGLNRGFACMGCRKRKSRCDTNRPSCEQCIKARMPCIYDDRPPKRPTDLLKERIKELEDQVKNLERLNPGILGASSSSPRGSGSGRQPSPTTSQAALNQARWESPSSSGSGPEHHPTSSAFFGERGLPRNTSNVRAGSERHPSNPPLAPFPRGPSEANILALVPDISNDPLPPHLDQQELLKIFFRHRHQVYFDISVSRFWQSVAPRNPMSSSSGGVDQNAPHPALLNAIYLLACFFSGSPELNSYEALFLQRARQAIANALEQADRLQHSIQAASLVAMYLHAKGRVLEGYYISCATARFAVGCGLHQVESPVWNGPNRHTSLGATPLPGVPPLLEPPRDPTELGERIHIWWQTWMVDQCSAIATNLPPALMDSTDPYSRIETGFPHGMSEFETGSLQIGRSNVNLGSLRSLYVETTPTRGTYHGQNPNVFDGRRMAMVVKATELFSAAWKLSKHDSKDEMFRAAFNTTDAAIHRFLKTLPSLVTEEGGVVPAYILPRSFALAAVIQLHWIVATEHDHIHPSYQICLNAATDMVAIIDDIAQVDFSYLELHVGTCWKLTADVLLREMLRAQRHDPEMAMSYQVALGKVHDATRRLSQVYPVLTELWQHEGRA